jgi:hypothetical protein
MDTAASAAYVLGMSLAAGAPGRPVTEAFGPSSTRTFIGPRSTTAGAFFSRTRRPTSSLPTAAAYPRDEVRDAAK